MRSLGVAIALAGALGLSCTGNPFDKAVCEGKGGVCIRTTDAGCEVDRPLCCDKDPACISMWGWQYLEDDPGHCTKAEMGSGCE